ncbi:hypothetical protein ACQYRI_00960 [Salmonella enterica]
MKELSKIDAELENKIVDIISNGNKLDDEKKFAEALNKYDEAYALLPEPKFEWEMISAWLAGCYFNVYFSLQNFTKAKDWAIIELKYRSSDIDITPYMNIGMASYELGDLDDAFNNFDTAYKYGQERPFKEYPKKYLNFYLSEKK